MIITDSTYPLKVIRELVAYEYGDGVRLTASQENWALTTFRCRGVKGLKEYLDSECGPAKSAGPVADLPTARI